MAHELTWLGHNCWSLQTGQHRILVDPFLDENPSAPVKAKDVSADFILVSHGHFDHIADAASIANRTNATVVSCFEIAQWLANKHGVQNTVGMNLGGGVNLPFGHVYMTLAHHTSSFPDGSYAGNPAGFLVKLAGSSIYFACDTALFSDMQLIGAKGIDLAVLPIGDLYTMGPDDSVEATKLLRPRRVAPAHYNTWPPIAQDANQWAEKIRSQTQAEPLVPKPGDKISL